MQQQAGHERLGMGSSAKEDERWEALTSLTPPLPSLEQIVEELFSQVQQEGLSNENLLSLHFVFSTTLFAALDIIDRNRVVQVVAQPSGRSFFRLPSHRKNRMDYICFSHYCSCEAFDYHVLKRGSLMCKHQLACRLAELLQRTSIKEVSDEQFAELLLQCS
ncbi:Zinc finger swim domain-containing protein 7-like [Balamuthia mandrillaris]